MFSDLDMLDEEWVAEVTNAIRENRIQIAVQGVHSIANLEKSLYGECFARLLDHDGAVHFASEFVPALEIWNRTPLLDRHVLKPILDALEADPALELGCNISTDSLVNEAGWHPIRSQLENRRHLNDRLVLEITETQPLSNIVTLRERIAEARELGCRVAIDDFGCGNIAPAQLLSLDVDIVKIDAVFVQNIKEGKGGETSLHHMIGLARCVSPHVVVEGIEDAAQLNSAVAAGCTHVQGYFLSKPEALVPRNPALGRNAQGSISLQ